MRNKITIKDDGMVIDENFIKWVDIRGIRSFNDPLLYQLGHGFPFSEIFLRNGRVVKLKTTIELDGITNNNFDDKYKKRFSEYFTVLNIILENAKDINSDFSNWVEWRLILPSCLIEGFVLLYGFITNKSIEFIVMSVIVGGILSLPFGWLWERKARKDLII